MKRLLLITAAVAIAAPLALAQGGPGRPDREEMRERIQEQLAEVDTNGDGAISKAEADAMRARHFDEVDANGDGVATQAEFEAHRERKQAERRSARYARLDTNGDGSVTKDEFLAGNDERFSRGDRNGDGTITREELREAAKQMREGRGERRMQRD